MPSAYEATGSNNRQTSSSCEVPHHSSVHISGWGTLSASSIIGLQVWTSRMILKKNGVLTGIRTTSESLDMSREKGVDGEAEGSCSYQTPRSTQLHPHRLLSHFASLLITSADFPHTILGLENGTLNIFLTSLYQHTLFLHTGSRDGKLFGLDNKAGGW